MLYPLSYGRSRSSGRGREIRTPDILLPKQVRYQTAPCPARAVDVCEPYRHRWRGVNSMYWFTTSGTGAGQPPERRGEASVAAAVRAGRAQAWGRIGRDAAGEPSDAVRDRAGAVGRSASGAPGRLRPSGTAAGVQVPVRAGAAGRRSEGLREAGRTASAPSRDAGPKPPEPTGSSGQTSPPRTSDPAGAHPLSARKTASTAAQRAVNRNNRLAQIAKAIAFGPRWGGLISGSGSARTDLTRKFLPRQAAELPLLATYSVLMRLPWQITQIAQSLPTLYIPCSRRDNG